MLTAIRSLVIKRRTTFEKTRKTSSAPCFAECLEPRRLLAADLSASFTAAPAAFTPKAPAKVAIRVTNAGDTTVAGTANVELFLSTDPTFDPTADTSIGTFSKRVNVRAGKGANLKYSIPVVSTVPDGNYYLFAQIEAGASSAVAASSGTVSVEQPFVQVLESVGQFGTFRAEDFPDGMLFAPLVPFVNAGNTVANGTVSARFFISSDPTITTDDVLVGSQTQSVSIKLGGNKAVRVKISIPGGLPPGVYDLVGSYAFTGALKAKGVEAPTVEEVQQATDDAQASQAQIDDAITAGQPPQQAIEEIRQVLVTQPNIVPGSIRVTDNTISFLTFQNVLTSLQARISGNASATAILDSLQTPVS